MAFSNWKFQRISRIFCNFLIPTFALRATDILGSSRLANYYIRPQILRLTGFKIGKECFIGPGIGIRLTNKDSKTYVPGNNGAFDVLSSFQIGDYCKIEEDVVFINDKKTEIVDFIPFFPFHNIEPIFVGDYAWISSYVQIVNCQHVGKGSVIGSGAIVDSDIPPDTLIDGKQIKTPIWIHRKKG